MFISKSKPYEKGDVVSFKMVNGDEIVARIVEDNNMEWAIERPTTVALQPKGIMLIASLMTAEPDFKTSINKQHVLYHAPSAKEVVDYYIQTTTGIQPVSAGGLVTGI
jgi:hypothetical protein